MTESIKTKLLNHTTGIRDIMFASQSAFKIVDFLYRDRSDVESEVINTNQFLKYTADTYWRIYTIEMAKLFANRKNEHFNIHDYIKKFKAGGEYNNDKITDSFILLWEQNLAMTKESKWIENVLQQRDGKYGHTDRDGKRIKNILSFADAKELLQIVQRILSEVYIVIFGQAMQFDPSNEPVEGLKRIMEILAARQQGLVDLEKSL